MIGLLVFAFILIAGALGYWLWLSKTYSLPIAPERVYSAKTKDLWEIKLFRTPPASGKGEPVLLCHGLLANHWNLMSPPGESLADYLAKAGYDCWAIDLRGTRSSVPPYGRKCEAESLSDYLFEDIPAAIGAIQRETGYSQVHWVGHSLGGMLLYAYDAAFGPKSIVSGVTLGSPPGFAGSHMARPGVLLYVLRYARPALSVVFRALTPLLCQFRINVRGLPMNWDNLKPGIDTRIFFNVIDLNSFWVAQELCDWAISKTWRMRNGALDIDAGMKKLAAPLFAIYGSRDPLTPKEAVQEFFDAIPHGDKKMLVLGKGEGADADYSHIDLAFSKNAEAEVYEPIVEWLRSHPIGGSPVKDGEDDVVFKKRARVKHTDPVSEAIIKGKAKPRASLAPHRRKK